MLQMSKKKGFRAVILVQFAWAKIPLAVTKDAVCTQAMEDLLVAALR